VNLPSWAHVKELLHQALALEPEARARFLDEVCASNATLRAELESLLSIGDERTPDSWNRRRPQNSVGKARGLAPRVWRRDNSSQSVSN
jgi:hypothetical protein